MHCNRQRVFDEISRWQVRDQPVKTATTWLLSRESGHEAKEEQCPWTKTDGGTGSKIPALEHDVDSREGVIMLSQAGETGARSKISDVCQ